jgi:biopolymer transport protein ExbB/TolQ
MEKISQLFHEGGLPVMLSITATLLLTLVLIVERFIRYWGQYDLADSASFMSHIQKMVMNNSIENAIRMCRKAKPKLLPEVLVQGLMRANDSPEEISLAMDYATLEAIPKVTARVGFLGTTANVATLLGLLGTLFGLMKSFAAAATATGAQKQTLLAEGIAEALIATSFGLGTALLALLCYGILMTKQTQIVDDINANAARLLHMLYNRKMKIHRGGSDRAE